MSTYPTPHDDLTCPNVREIAALRKRVEELQADLDAALDMMLCQSGDPGDGCSSHPRVLALLEKRRGKRG